jgi:hypothetical protein
MKTYLLSCVAVLQLSLGVTFAQTTYSVSEETYDFGQIQQGVPASHEFVITNTGKEPLIISGVRASCGCTTPFWTKEPIAPGETGIVKASYNAAANGPFHKSVTVTTNGTPATKVLYIKGEVKQKIEKKYTPEELANSPKLEIEKATYAIGNKLELGQKSVAKFNIKNTGKTPLEISNVTSPCNCTSFSTSKPTIAPNETARLDITYTSRNIGDINEIVQILSNDLNNPSISVTLTGKVVETQSSTLRETGAATPFK